MGNRSLYRFAVCVCLWNPLSSAAAVSVAVPETFPAASTAVLEVDQSLYLRIAYTSDTPVRIHVRPVLQDGSNNYITGGSVLLPSGNGETLGWFALRAPGIVTGYRIAADTDNSGYPKELTTLPARIEWKRGGMMTDTGPPAWIDDINRRNEALWKAEMRNSKSKSPFFDLVLGLVIVPLLFGIPLLALALSIVASIRWTGAWRYAAGLPLALSAIWLVNFLVDVTRDSTSHNLWPFELLYWAVPTLAWLAALYVARKWRTPGSAD
jgi:hypothetical protein